MGAGAGISESDWLGDDAETVEPAAPLTRGGRPRKHGRSRLRKIHCEGCGFIAQTTFGSLDRAGALPACGCGSGMTLANFRDRVEYTPDQARDELLSAPRALAVELRREVRALGHDPDAWAHDDRFERGSQGRAGTSRCQWEGGYCMVFTSGRYCAEHARSAGLQGRAA